MAHQKYKLKLGLSVPDRGQFGENDGFCPCPDLQDVARDVIYEHVINEIAP